MYVSGMLGTFYFLCRRYREDLKKGEEGALPAMVFLSTVWPLVLPYYVVYDAAMKEEK